MEIEDKRVLVLGGWGLVGSAICRGLISEKPKEIIVSSLAREEAEEAVQKLEKLNPNQKIKLTPSWGNIFLRDTLQGISRSEIIENQKYREQLIEDVLGDLTPEILIHSHLYRTIQKYRPQIVIDSINSATALAYQDVFLGYYRVRKELKGFKSGLANTTALVNEMEKLLITLYIPQLIRHVQILYEVMMRVKTKIYLKIGTSGTGGMGLNIPYTHSEEKPSRVLLSKTSVAGAHTLLLFLMARTPDAPITKEIKPTAAIAWKRIGFGPIKKGNRAIELFDCDPENAMRLKREFDLKEKLNWRKLKDGVMESVFIDTGENGIFSKAEFMTLTTSGQMEYVTPEEIARNVIYEIKGRNTGYDIINALDNATLGPTYRAGYLRHTALKKMEALEKAHGVESVAFELLGPPRLSKLLYEAYLLRKSVRTMENLKSADEEALSRELANIIRTDAKLRSRIISIGIPILMPDGLHLLRGPVVKIPPYRGEDVIEIKPGKIDIWAHDGWVDLRASNIRTWKNRIAKIFAEIEAVPPDDTSSQYDQDRQYWLEDEEIDIGKIVGWIFTKEEKGLRMKD
ncbi:MAG TPA: short-chain dehydrogenase [Bacteroidetes bacterium]|nr:short-chain dehydrogenase [Bacteroidota bacterium]